MLFAIAILGVWVCGDLAVRGEWKIPRSAPAIAMALALIYWGVSAIISPTAARAVTTWGLYASGFVFCWAIIRFVSTPRRVEFFLTTLVVTNILMAIYGGSQLFGNDLLVMMGLIPSWGPGVYVSTHGSQNFFAAALIATLPVFLGLAIRRPWVWVLVPVNLWLIIESESRGAYIGVVVSMFAGGIILLSLRRRRWAAGLIAIGCVALVFHSKLIDDLSGMFSESSVRPVFYREAIDGALIAPVLGRGLGSFNYQMPESRVPSYHRIGSSHNTDHPHSESLEWLHDTGIIGLALFWLIVSGFVVTGYQGLRRNFNPILLGAILGPIAFQVESSFLVSSRWTGAALTFWTVVGLATALSHHENPTRKPRPIAAKVMAVIFVIGFGAVAVQAARLWESDRLQAMNAAFTDGTRGPSVAEALEYAEDSRKLEPSNASMYYKLAYTQLVGGNIYGALETYRTLQALAPNYAQIHINLAYVNDQLKLRSASAWERDRAALIEDNTRNHRDAAAYWLQLGNTSRALAHLQHCFVIGIDRADDGFHFWLQHDELHTDAARVYTTLGQLDRAEFELKQAIALNPANVQAAILFDTLLRESGRDSEADVLMSNLEVSARNSPAILALNFSRALAAGDYASAIQFADTVAQIFQLPAPGEVPTQEANELGNAILEDLQKMVVAEKHKTQAYALAGWIMASQGRYQEGKQFLDLAYALNPDAVTGERLAKVRARLRY